MSAIRYIFIDDQGHVFSRADEPTAEDLEFAKVGMRTIVRLDELRYYGRERQWLPIPAGRLTSADIDGERSKIFHAPPSVAE